MLTCNCYKLQLFLSEISFNEDIKHTWKCEKNYQLNIFLKKRKIKNIS
jgi:hypothetical protein